MRSDVNTHLWHQVTRQSVFALLCHETPAVNKSVKLSISRGKTVEPVTARLNEVPFEHPHRQAKVLQPNTQTLHGLLPTFTHKDKEISAL